MTEKVYAINICLIPSKKMYDICYELNAFDTFSEYNNNSRSYIPHVTLVMKWLKETELKELKKSIDNIDSRPLSGKVGEYYAKYVPENDCWTGIHIEKADEVLHLQDEICKMTEKYANSPSSRENYAVDDFFEEKEIKESKESEFQEREDLHITLGKADIQNHIDKTIFPQKTIFEKLVIGHMGNYGSVRDILYFKELK